MNLLTASAAEVSADAGKVVSYFENKLPDLIQFGIKVLVTILLFVIGSKVIHLLRKILRKSLERSSADLGVAQFLDSLMKFGLYFLLIFMIAVRFGVEPSSVAALIGSAGLAIGLALQGSLSNFAGGVLILLLRPFVVGDYIIEDTNKNEGTVKEIQLFYTKLATVDNKIIVIPNGTLSNHSLTNVTAQAKRRLDLKVGISYDSDLKHAKKMMEQLLLEEPLILKEEELIVFVDELGDHAVMIASRSWVKTEHYWEVKWRLNEKIKLTFDEEGIDIPVPQLEVTIKETEKQ